MMISLLDRVENTVGKGENAGYQHFLLFSLCFPNPSLGSLKGGIVLNLFCCLQMIPILTSRNPLPHNAAF